MPGFESFQHEEIHSDMLIAAGVFANQQTLKIESLTGALLPMTTGTTSGMIDPVATAKKAQNERFVRTQTRLTAAPSSAPAPADEISKARAMIAKVDAAEKAGTPMTEQNMKKLGYVKTQGGVWELPIPASILRQL